ncbi:unnamed protein product [marine sediment metagenome]|uniref:Uncharacterized protein n=1 Tax=marine sediment metagenome TaxID=412755 RepID=X0TER9_9ZZZZ
MNFITNWLEKRRDKKSLGQYNRGFDYAAGEILRGTNRHVLLNYTDTARTMGDYNSWDAGIEDADREIRKLKGELK